VTATTRRTCLRGGAAGLIGASLVTALLATPASAAPGQPPELGYAPAVAAELATAGAPALGAAAAVPVASLDGQRQIERRAAAERAIRAEQRRAAAAKKKAAAQAARAAERRRAQEVAARKKRSTERVVPVRSYTLTARFGAGGGRWSSGRHTGLDFAAPTGTPVRAAMSGTVLSAGWDGAYGRRIEIRHADGTVTSYSHLSAMSVSAGTRVDGGQVIGAIGTTGNTSGAHLHFEVQRDDRFVDPARWLRLR